jgi:hypothetical protein
MVSRWALAAVVACGEATKPGLAPDGSLNQQSPTGWKVALGKEYGPNHHSLLKMQRLQDYRSEESAS